MNAEERRFLAACHAMGGLLASPLKRDWVSHDDMARYSVQSGDALIRRLAETAPAGEPEPPPADANKILMEKLSEDLQCEQERVQMLTDEKAHLTKKLEWYAATIDRYKEHLSASQRGNFRLHRENAEAIRRCAELEQQAMGRVEPPAATKKRVLIHVVGGVATWVSDACVDVVAIDWDDDATMTLEHIQYLRTQFAGLITDQELLLLEGMAS